MRTGCLKNRLLQLICLALAVPGLAGCATIQREQVELPIRHAVEVGQLVFYSDFQIPSDHRLLRELGAQRQVLEEQLALGTSNESIRVYLFESTPKYSAFMRQHYPELPQRRAYFIESDTRLAVYAFWGDRVAEDLRHEVTHGYLHSVAPHIPLWVDEGLAEYYEVPRNTSGMNWPHLREALMQLNTGGWRPDLNRLEQLQNVHEMSLLDYAESWAWMHLLLETTPDRHELLVEYLRDLQTLTAVEPLSVRIRRRLVHPEDALVAHLHVLGSSLHAGR